jgi:hypothetical protein
MQTAAATARQGAAAAADPVGKVVGRLSSLHLSPVVSDRLLAALGGGEEGDGEEDCESKEAATGPKPTLEELGVKFVLNTFNGNTSERSPAARPISPLCLLSASAPLPGCCQATGAC